MLSTSLPYNRLNVRGVMVPCRGSESPMSADKRIARRIPPSLAVGLVLVTIALAACGTDRDITGGQPRGPEIPRTSLIVHVRLQPSDAGAGLNPRLGERRAGRRSEPPQERDRGLAPPENGRDRQGSIGQHTPGTVSGVRGPVPDPGGGLGGGASGSKLRRRDHHRDFRNRRAVAGVRTVVGCARVAGDQRAKRLDPASLGNGGEPTPTTTTSRCTTTPPARCFWTEWSSARR